MAVKHPNILQVEGFQNQVPESVIRCGLEVKNLEMRYRCLYCGALMQAFELWSYDAGACTGEPAFIKVRASVFIACMP